MTNNTKNAPDQSCNSVGGNVHINSAEDHMNKHKSSHLKAYAGTQLICARIKLEAAKQGYTFGSFRECTGLSPREVLRVWIGHNPSIWVVERCRLTLGLTDTQVWEGI